MFRFLTQLFDRTTETANRSTPTAEKNNTSQPAQRSGLVRVRMELETLEERATPSGYGNWDAGPWLLSASGSSNW